MEKLNKMVEATETKELNEQEEILEKWKQFVQVKVSTVRIILLKSLVLRKHYLELTSGNVVLVMLRMKQDFVFLTNVRKILKPMVIAIVIAILRKKA